MLIIFGPREGLQWKARSVGAVHGCRTCNGKPGPRVFPGARPNNGGTLNLALHSLVLL